MYILTYLACYVYEYGGLWGVSLFIGLRGINGTLTAFLGLFADFKRKLDLAVVAMPPKAGMRMR